MESNKTRTDLLNFLIEKHVLKSYLEIGLQNASQNFDKIECEYKVSVDPDGKANADYIMTSDAFFDCYINYPSINELRHGKTKPEVKLFDLIFIDGLHTAEQVQKDFENALKILSPKGFIVLHDCNPLKEEHTIVPRPKPTGHWNGDVVKFAVKIAQYGFTVDIDNGCFVYKNTKENNDKILPVEWDKEHLNLLRLAFSWQDFDKNRKKLLNLISWDEFISTYPHV